MIEKSTSRFSLTLLALLVCDVAGAQAVQESEEKAHESSGAGPVASTELVAAGWEKGFFLQSSDGVNKLKIGARVQTRFTHEAVDGDDDETAFSIPRARLALSGSVHTKALRYKLQMDLGKGSVSLKDFYLDYSLVPKTVVVRAGQWKRPFSRQQITSSGKQELVDRAITDKAFGAGRDIGVAIHNNLEKSPTIEYAVGLFNGTGDKARFGGDVLVDPETGEGEVEGGKFSNVPSRFNPALVARTGYNYGEIKGYSEADLEGGPLRFGMGLSGLINFDSDDDDDGNIATELDFIAKLHGFSISTAGYLAWAQDGSDFSSQAFGAWGVHAQAGYVLLDRFQPAVRYAYVAREGMNNDQQEVGGGLSVYLFRHKLKWQTDVLALTSQQPGQDPTDWLIRTQAQLAL